MKLALFEQRERIFLRGGFIENTRFRLDMFQTGVSLERVR
jgi:hypothetical protein